MKTNRLDIQVFDPKSFYEKMDNDESMIHHISGLFIKSCPKYVEEMGNAIQSNSSRKLFEIAHNLKGELLIFGHDSAVKLAEELESLGRRGQITGADQILERLSFSLKPIFSFIKDLLENSSLNSSK